MLIGEGGNNDPGPPAYLPDPFEVARAVALKTGNANMNPGMYSWDFGTLHASFQISSSELHSGTAVVRLLFHEYGYVNDPTILSDRKQFEAPIGHFRPDLGIWTLYDEFLPPENVQLGHLMEQLDDSSLEQDRKWQEQRESGEQFLDLRDPLTRNSRAIMSHVLSMSDLDSALITRSPYLTVMNDDGSESVLTVGHDGSTTPYMVIAPQFDSRALEKQIETMEDQRLPMSTGIPFVNTLSVVWQGATFRKGDFTTRGEHTVHIATQTGTDRWQPLPGVLADSEWRAIEFIPSVFAIDKRANGSFLADRCAVGHNMQDSYVLAE